MNQLPSSVIPAVGPPAAALPERVLQFGTGVLLRGLVDFLIDKANKQSVFNGSVVVVKSTGNDVSEFAQQENRYSVWVRGVQNGQPVEEQTVITAISRVLAAQTQWEDVLALARKPSLQIVVSNTTEVGLQYVEESIFQTPPSSFPAKLTAFLYERFKGAGGSRKMGLVVVPTELLPDNGLRLRNAVERTAQFNELGKLFMKWLKFHVRFCNSLVDRIVTGKPDEESTALFEQKAGYSDSLLTATEPYYFWAIEGDDRVRKVLSFAEVSPTHLIIDEDISFYRERKLRLLNGAHTFMTPLSYLLGNVTVEESMNHPLMGPLITKLMMNDIAPSVPTDLAGDDGEAAVNQFAQEVLDRFRNPFNEHFLLNITLQQSAKMQVRNVPTMQRLAASVGNVPDRMALCFAAYLLFMRANRQTEEGDYIGEIIVPGGELVYPIRDAQAAYFYQKWQSVKAGDSQSITDFVQAVLADKILWQADLTELPGFADKVATYLTTMLIKGVEAAVKLV
ncbi:tagaturonate reductase [uncultured Fibrella sp.]|uniref:tagaturonate reductase n=1 Tax=uncultured Fibrella sp. TaxID=1284596 RepID=UPI0035CA4B91